MQENKIIHQENLRDLSRWSGFVGIITIISGVISAATGLFFFIIGAIPGIIAVIMGMKLRNAKNYADKLLYSSEDKNTEELNLLVDNLTTYFKIQGVLIIVILVFILLSILSTAFFGAAYL